MTKLIVEIKPDLIEIDLDGWLEDYYDKENGWDEDGLYDGLIHEIVTQPEYNWRIES